MNIYIFFLLTYICGSIPFGIIFTKLFSNKDLRNIGSGNIGATNVLRTGNKFLALLTLIFDIIKGYLPVYVAINYYPNFIELTALIVLLGHIFPIWLKFKGGKGVATYLGILLAYSVVLGVLFIFTWIVVALIFKYSSVSSIFSSATVFVINGLRELAQKSAPELYANLSISYNLSTSLFVFLILIIFTHRSNIYKLKNKIETKIKI